MSVRIALLALVSPLALIAAPAAAQEAAPEAPAAGEDNGEIVVTAQLVRQTVNEVPFALTAYTGDFLDNNGITEFDRLGQFVPGFDVQNQSPNNPGFVMRGITSDSGSAFNEPRVSVFQDGVSISKSRGSYVELFDLERVEIAKGPQSTLYGRGALIGAVNLIQAKADPSGGYGMVQGTYGNFDSWRIDQTVNLPLTDTLAIRVASRIRERGGYVENLLGGDDYNGIKSEAVRASVRWAPGAFTLDVIGNYQHDRATGTSFKSTAFVPTDPTTGAVIGDTGRNSGAALVAGAGFEGGKSLGLDRDVWGVTAIANYELSDTLSINAIGSYREFAGIEVFDPDGISLPILTAAEDAQGDQTMATLRLTYSNDRVTAFVGGTYYRESGLQRTPLQFDERLALARLVDAQVPGVLAGGGLIPGRPANVPAPFSVLTNPAFTGSLLRASLGSAAALLPTPAANAIAANFGPAYRESSTNDSKTESFDLFGDATFHVTDRFEVGAGVRYTHDSKETGFASSVTNGRSMLAAFQFAGTLPPAAIPGFFTLLATPGAANLPVSASFPLFALFTQPTAGNGGRVAQTLTDSGFTWRAIARYEFSPQVSVYANYARGRRPEVLSVTGPSVPFGAPRFSLLPSETVDSFEVGTKTVLANRTLFLDGSVFYYRYSNFQTIEQQGLSFVVVNAGKAESYGFEGQFRWNPANWVSLYGTYAYNHSRFASGARDGNRFRLSPDHSASLGARFSVDAGPVVLDLTPSLMWQSKVFFDDDNDLPALQVNNLIADTVQDEYQDSYVLGDVRFGIETPNGRWRIEGFVTNVFDRKFIKDAGNTGDGLGLPTFIAGEPRMYGASLRLKIGK
ncbi:TonB-dependent receptor [Sphingomonas sp. AOB5]|uniref:TonB-dependent receptor n=1 Tax=Sphingomonas sp. AOB5 TaxID=3034017 RepID=UPI0023F92039|nr:TonB-dependent receptor [Sphingomonas sp. AOB5]MDF7774961.1 TonB-dependent receptor [Sphingomonas sp. AOB5]